ncbi:MAG TPA: hypothetical protein VNH18_21205, partial [Bryobacteraceae bacterium]|nr:hypothetical protein [Bryobacteraceae bacterium]
MNKPLYGKGFWARSLAWSVATGFSVYGVAHALIDGFFKEHETDWAYPLLVVKLLALLGTFVFVFLVVAARNLTRGKRTAELFGGATGSHEREIWIVVSSYNHAKPFEGDIKDRYFKTDSSAPQGTRFVRGSRVAVVGLETVTSAVFAYEQARKLPGFSVKLNGDSNVDAFSE